jgi:hypothetical protein
VILCTAGSPPPPECPGLDRTRDAEEFSEGWMSKWHDLAVIFRVVDAASRID